MRKAQKQKILDCIKSLYQAHIEMKTALVQKNIALVEKMLGECQEFAVAFGENIEKVEGENHITVSYIEEYCEALFCIFEEIQNNQINENTISKILKKNFCK